MVNECKKLLAEIRKRKPLLHHITNYVVMNDNANIALHIGASPVMAHAYEEIEEMTSLASALVINIGTLDKDWIKSMELAISTANKRGIPVILDPVGAGATQLRTDTALRFLSVYQITVLKGNAGEISVLAGLGGQVKGVDSVSAEAPLEAARTAAEKFGVITAITGKEDIVSDGKNTLIVKNGHQWLSTITGSGCNATTVISAFVAVADNILNAVACGLGAYGVAAEIAAQKAQGPASFKQALFDAVYNLSDTDIEKLLNIENV